MPKQIKTERERVQLESEQDGEEYGTVLKKIVYSLPSLAPTLYRPRE